MLRFTYSKIKNLRNVSLVSRLLRPDQCSTNIKFEKFPTGLQSQAFKSIYSNELEDGKNKKTDGIEYIYGKDIGVSMDPMTSENDGLNGQVIQEMISENLTQMMSPTNEAVDSNDRCKKLIAQAFGYEDAEANSIQSTLQLDKLVGTSKERKKSDSVDNCPAEEHREKEHLTIPDLFTVMEGNIEDIEVTHPEKNSILSAIVDGGLLGNSNIVNPAKNKNVSKVEKTKDVFNTPILETIASKETEEELKQKYEHHEEPIIGTEKPSNVEGFNVTPKILGGKDYILEGGQNIEYEKISPAEYDELAKQCLYTVDCNIDETLLKEMERIGVLHSPNANRTIPNDPTKKPLDDLYKLEHLIPESAVIMHETCLNVDNGQDSEATDKLAYERIILGNEKDIIMSFDDNCDTLIDDRTRYCSIVPNLKGEDLNNEEVITQSSSITRNKVSDNIGVFDQDKGTIKYDIEKLSDHFFSTDKSILQKTQTQKKKEVRNELKESPGLKMTLKKPSSKPEPNKVNIKAVDLQPDTIMVSRALNQKFSSLSGVSETSKSVNKEQASEPSCNATTQKIYSQFLSLEQVEGAADTFINPQHDDIVRKPTRHTVALERGLGIGLADKNLTKSRRKALLKRLQKPLHAAGGGKRQIIISHDDRNSIKNKRVDDLVSPKRGNPHYTDLLIDAEIEKKLSAVGVTKEEFASKLSKLIESLPNKETNLIELQNRIRIRNQLIQAKKAIEMLASNIAARRCRKPPPSSGVSSTASDPTSPTTFQQPSNQPSNPGPKSGALSKDSGTDSTKFSILDLILCPNILEAHENDDDLLENIKSFCDKNKAVLTREIIENLQNIRNELEKKYDEIIDMLINIWRRKREDVVLVKNYEPWSPIPSWPNEKKSKKQKYKKDSNKEQSSTKDTADPQCPNTVKNEDSPVLSRSFFKTDWTKPKFDIKNKPFVNSRIPIEDEKVINKTQTLSVTENSNIKAKKVIENSNNNVRKFSTKVQCDNIKITTKRFIPHGNTLGTNLNLERLLLPPMASVSYMISQNYTNDSKKNVFWRPLDRVPTESEWNKRAAEPGMRKEMEKEARYLLLSFDNMELVPPKHKAVNNNVPKGPRIEEVPIKKTVVSQTDAQLSKS